MQCGLPRRLPRSDTVRPKRPAPRRRVGLLGGSFNPAHAGHRHVSLIALRRLALDEVWWLVSPQNPLKPAKGMASLARRMASANDVTSTPTSRWLTVHFL